MLRGRNNAWVVEFEGEGAQDAGGPYRESLSSICDELQSSKLPLLIPCPNARDETGQNIDQWIPNPSCDTWNQYEFLGKLMGIAMRTGKNTFLGIQ